ncbi:MAG: pyridoxal phosphate-dependent aminotransferase [SAR202 cluster bacterium]|jgi:aspartate aminotransferase|nr:MAG: pyridoxal phosphate-dependent aminotransferase [SAR202 cluster bacterium]KAA1300141.1 MAG: pyridoxal phosphate-dependent aminotransferase [SAR202 cluster bacterium]|tara:strand:- start:2395 stop:3576 length:1182 start_codon:yes stop_codon:yes gene_type:complete
MSISKAILDVLEQSSWIRKMFEEGIQLKKEFGEKNIFDLSLGNPLLEPPEKFKKKLIELSNSDEKGLHRYMPNQGFQSTREKVANSLAKESNFPITAEELIITTGAAGGVNAILKSILNPNDEIIVFSPFFVEYLFYIKNHNGIPVIAKTDENFFPDLSDLSKKITKNTKGIIINSPNNPTGVLYPIEIIEKIGEILSSKEKELGTEIYLISDEPYRKIIFDNKKYPFIFPHHDRSIVVTSHSKDLGLAGERIGYIALSPKDKDKQVLYDALVFSLRTLGHVNATAIMQKSIEDIQEESVDINIYKQKRDYIYDELIQIGYECVKPDGAFYLFPKSPIEDDAKFVRILQNSKVLTVPGRGFGLAGYFRISYSVDDWVLEGSIEGFKKAFESIK